MTEDSSRSSSHNVSLFPPPNFVDSHGCSPPSVVDQGQAVDISINAPQWEAETSFDARALIEKCLTVTLLDVVHSKVPFELSVLLTNDLEIQQLNKDYRQKDKPTNVLSFESGVPIQTLALQCKREESLPGQTAIPLGDIALSYETILRESQEQNKSFENHFTHLMLHGILHLLGFDHEFDSEAEAMEDLETRLLKTHFNINNPYETKD